MANRIYNCGCIFTQIRLFQILYVTVRVTFRQSTFMIVKHINVASIVTVDPREC